MVNFTRSHLRWVSVVESKSRRLFCPCCIGFSIDIVTLGSADLTKIPDDPVAKSTIANKEVLRVGQLATTSKQLTRDGPSGPWDCVGCAGLAPTPTEGMGGHIVWVATLPGNETALALFNIAVRGKCQEIGTISVAISYWYCLRPEQTNETRHWLAGQDDNATVGADLSAATGGAKSCKLRDLWAQKDLGSQAGTIQRLMGAHTAALFSLTDCA